MKLQPFPMKQKFSGVYMFLTIPCEKDRESTSYLLAVMAAAEVSYSVGGSLVMLIEWGRSA